MENGWAPINFDKAPSYCSLSYMYVKNKSKGKD